MRAVTHQEAMKAAFIWAYKGCSCCGRVLPDSRKDQLGKCNVCRVPRVLVDKPIGWDTPLEIYDEEEGSVTRVTTLWMYAWTNRPPEKLCKHEKKGLGLHD